MSVIFSIITLYPRRNLPFLLFLVYFFIEAIEKFLGLGRKEMYGHDYSSLS